MTSAPAAPIDQWHSLSNHTNMNVTVTVCGIISSAETAWIRHSTFDPRYGLASSSVVAVARGFRGGSRTPSAHAIPDNMQITAANVIAAAKPCSASSGITAAPNAIPKGWAVCRTPIATPRRSGGNQPVTSRPVAELAPAAAMPPRNRKAPISTSEWVDAAAKAASAVSPEPNLSTMRSPARSTT
ncbi:hypothetical protein MNVI_31370 [Mycobacterium noviomagense]|uniref:Uncharacterized protein n=1 Tax=Mycobacterium noviomagense TaxID=459858 RepID=A0A7I7PH06_9MYCO|nr:hypothetical protein MNVI_31370 [Mycobacterium noviomagense]